MDAERIAALIGLIYDAALSGEWLAPVMEISRVSGSHHVVLMDDDHRDQLLVGSGNPLIEAAYADQFAPLNDAWPSLTSYPVGMPVLDRATLDMEHYCAGIFFNEFAKPNGLVAATGGVVARDGKGATTAIVLNRPEREADHETADLVLLGLVLPHFRRALHLRTLSAPHGKRGLDLEVAQREAGAAIVVVDDRGVVLDANGAGQRHVADGQGIFARPDGPGVESLHPDLLPALANACSPLPERRVAARKLIDAFSAGGRYGVTVLPLQGAPSWAGTTRTCYALLLTDATVEAVARLTILTQRYGMTRREAEIVLRLGDSAALADIASSLGVRLSTAKTLLSRAMDKTGVHSQVQLVRMVERLRT